MELGVVGLGRMGANLVRRLSGAGQRCVVFDIDPDAVEALAKESGVTGVSSLEELVATMPAPRVVWVMVPAGEITDKTVSDLAQHLDAVGQSQQHDQSLCGDLEHAWQSVVGHCLGNSLAYRYVPGRYIVCPRPSRRR